MKTLLSVLNPMRWWRQILRNIDHKILFPQIRALAGDDEVKAAGAILIHCVHDVAWECDPMEYSKRDVKLFVELAKVLPTQEPPEAS